MAASSNRLLLAGMLLWTLALCARWPLALSFGDEIGYVGHAKLILEGHVLPPQNGVGVWVPTPEGPRAQYPLLVALLFAPLVAVAPRLVFASGVVAALALAWVAGRVLRAWGRSSAWGLIVLLHPTLILVARTAMADLLLAAFTVGGWWAVRRDRRAAAVALLALAAATKPIGFLLVLAIVVGEAAQLVPRLRPATGSASPARAITAAGGFAAGLVLTMALNKVAAGRLWFGYEHKFLSTPPFWYTYLRSTAPLHVRSLLLLPPLLIAGVWPFWRRRDFGPVLVIAGLSAMMCFYFFVDTGRTWLETLVLSPRLILPAVAFLLIGYAELLAGLAARRPRLWPAVAGALVVLPALIAFAIAVRHRRWQEPQAVALATASRLAAERGSHELGITPGAEKIGLLYPGHVSWVTGARAEAQPDDGPPVVLCTARTWSYRTADTPIRCELPGYDDQTQVGHDDGFHFLVRRK